MNSTKADNHSDLTSNTENNSMAKLILDIIPNPVFSLDGDYKYTEFNKMHALVMKDLYGVDIQIGHPIYQYQTEDDWELAKINIDKALSGEEFVESGFSGKEELIRLYFEIFHTPIKDNDGKITGVSVFVKDTTEKNHAFNLLKESEERFELLFEKAPMGYQSLDVDGCFLDVNQKWLDMLGYEKEEVIGKWFGDFLTPAYTEGFRNRFPIFKSQGHIHSEFEMIHKDGHVLFIAFDGKIGYNQQGEFQQTHCILQDVTEQRKTEKELTESEEKFRNVFEYSSVGKSLTTLDGRLRVNKAFCDILGYFDEELNQLNWRDITHSDDIEKNEKSIELLLKGEKKSDNFEKRYVHKNGHIVWVDLTVTLQSDETGKPLYFISEITDITERKLAEEKLSQSELFFRESQQAAGIGSYKLEMQTGMWTSSEVLDGIFGIDTNYERSVTGWSDMVFEDDREMMNNHFAVDVLQKRMPFNKEYRIKRKLDGEIRWVHGLGKLIFDEQNQLVSMYGTIQDITDRKINEESIRKSEERLNRAEFASKSGNWELLVEFEIVKASKGAANVYGLKKEEFIYKNIKQIPLEEYRPMLDLALRNLIEKNEPYDIEFKIKTADTGEIKDIHSTAVYDIERKVVFGVIQDITDRKKAEFALIENEQKLSALFNGMSEMAVIHELIFDEKNQAIDYRIIDCNKSFTKITGIPREKAIGGLSTQIFKTEEPPYLKEYTEVCRTGKNYEFQTYFLPLDKHFLISVVSIGENRLATITTDITDIQKVKEVILEKNKQLENYMYVASHDLRSPLVNIQGFSQRLETQTEELVNQISQHKIELSDLNNERTITDNIRKSLRFILNNVAKMDTLINGLLQLSRTGQIQVNIHPIHMSQLIEKVLNTFNYQLTTCNAEIRLGKINNCLADENQINQLFSNLINNAYKYRDKDRKLKIEISSKLHFNKVIYRISDNGIGIAENQIQRIWDLFYRIDSVNSEKGEGLGLSLAKQIAGKNNGKIWVESQVGIGSTFFVELPAAD